MSKLWSGSSPEQDPLDFQTINYKYDLYGRRSEKKVDGFSTRYVYDGPHVIAEYDGNNNLLHKYIYGPGVDQPVCMIEVADSNEPYYYHYDGLGSVVALSDSSGDTVQTYEYSIYGQVAVEDINHPNPYMFAGRRFDIEIGLYYNRARYYNPFIGRFLQTDPIGYGGGMNMYAYCGNNSLNYVDPSGLRGLRGDLQEGEDLTGVVYTESGMWWGLVGEWGLEDLAWWYACEISDFKITYVDGIPLYVENPDPEGKVRGEIPTNDGDIVWLGGNEIATYSPAKDRMLASWKTYSSAEPYENPWWVGPVIFFGELSGTIYDTFHATDGSREILGYGCIATGGSLVLYAGFASSPPGWVLGAAAVYAEVGGILVISENVRIWDIARPAVQEIGRLREEEEATIEEINEWMMEQ